MTGILPIKKYGTHSALNMFDEFSMLDSFKMQKYIGFTNDEVKLLCEKYRTDFAEMKAWYDGYFLNGEELYCPRSVVRAIDTGSFRGFWTETERYEALAVYIAMNYDGRFGSSPTSLCRCATCKPTCATTLKARLWT
jgi:hypothetical protein